MDNLQLGIEWDVDNAKLKERLNDSRKVIEGAGQTADVVQQKVNQNINNTVINLTKLDKTYDQLKIQADSYARIAQTSLDPKVIADYNSKLESVKKQMAEIKRIGMPELAAGSGKSTWNGLQNSINQVSRELPAFTYSAQTGFMAIANNIPILTDEINKLRQANAELNASGQKGVPVWKQLLRGLLSWQTAMMVGITLVTVYGKEIGEWVKGLFNAKKQIDQLTESQKSLDAAFKSNEYTKAVVEVKKLEIGLDLAKKGMMSKKAVVEEYNKTIGKTTGAVKTFAEVEDFLLKNTENYVKMTLYKAAANLALEEAAKKAMEAEKSRLKDLAEFESRLTETMPGARSEEQFKQQQRIIERQRQERKDAEIKAAKDAETVQVGIANRFLKQSQEVASKMGVFVLGDDPDGASRAQADGLKKAYEDILKVSKNGLDKINKLDNEYKLLTFSEEDAEKEALKQKFAEFRKIIAEENEKISKYNADNAKKKSFKAVGLIDTALVDPIEQRAGEQLDYSQSTVRIQKQYDEEYKVFQEYEELKASTSVEYANKRFADQLEQIKSFESRLATELARIGTGDLNAQEQKRADDLAKIQNGIADKRQADEDKHMADALKAYLSYNQKREKVIKDAEEDITRLTAAGLMEQAEERRKARDKGMEELVRTEISENDAFKDLEKNLDKMGFNMSLKAVKIGRKTVSGIIEGSKMTPADKAKLTKEFDAYFDGLENGVKSENYEHITSLIQGFDQLVNMATQFDGTMGTALKTVGSMVGQVASLTKAIGEGISGVGKGLASSGSGVAGIIGAVLSVVGSVVQIFEAQSKKREQEAQQRAQYAFDFQIKQLNVVNSVLEKQLSLVKDIYGVERVKGYVDVMKDASDEFNKNMDSWGRSASRYEPSSVKDIYQLTGNKDLDAKITEYNNLKPRGDDRRSLEDFIKTKNRLNKEIKSFGLEVKNLELAFSNVEDITSTQVLELHRLLEGGKLDEATAAVVRSLIDSAGIYKRNE